MTAPLRRHESKVGRSADDIMEAEAGSTFHRALDLVDLGSALYAVEEGFGYDEDPEAAQLVLLCKTVSAYLSDLSVAEDGSLTLKRECSRCSGNGKTTGEDPCIECAGRGYVHAEEADG